MTEMFLLYSNTVFKQKKKRQTRWRCLVLKKKIINNFETKLFITGIFLGFRKAFDFIKHDILFYKLSFYGILGVASDLLLIENKSYMGFYKRLFEVLFFLLFILILLYVYPWNSFVWRRYDCFFLFLVHFCMILKLVLTRGSTGYPYGLTVINVN